MTGRRNDDGLLMPLVLGILVLLVLAGAVITIAATTNWKSALRVDADSEAANILASAENIVDALSAGVTGDASRNPEQGCVALHTDYTDPNNPISPSSCPPGWTAWMPLPSRDGCAVTVQEGCWRARFTKTTEAVQISGNPDPVNLPLWTITLQAAARCDALPDLANAHDICVTVTDETVITAESNPPPLFPTLLYSGRLWPESEDATTADCLTSPEATPMWCAIPDPSRPPDGTQVQVSVGDVADRGIFVNDMPEGFFSCAGGYCTITPKPSDDNRRHARTVQGLLPEDLADDACSTTSTPRAVEWTHDPLLPPRPAGVTDHAINAMVTLPDPAFMPAASDPQMIVATGSVTITGNINGDDWTTSELEVLLIVSGCHIIIDSPCIFSALTVGDPDSAPQACDGSALDLTIYDLTLGRRVPVTLINVLIVAAGGIWAADLAPPSPVLCPDPLIPGSGYQAPALEITGSVITGHAGAVSILYDCDGVPGLPERIVAGYARTSSLPADTDAWATADIAWWPGRDSGTWRRR